MTQHYTVGRVLANNKQKSLPALSKVTKIFIKSLPSLTCRLIRLYKLYTHAENPQKSINLGAADFIFQSKPKYNRRYNVCANLFISSFLNFCFFS